MIHPTFNSAVGHLLATCLHRTFGDEERDEQQPEVRHIESLTEWYKSGQRKDAVLTMSEWLAAVKQWKTTQ